MTAQQVAVWISPWWIVARRHRSWATRKRSVTPTHQTRSMTWPSHHHPCKYPAQIALTPRLWFLRTTSSAWSENRWKRVFEELGQSHPSHRPCLPLQRLPVDAWKNAASLLESRQHMLHCQLNVSASLYRTVSRRKWSARRCMTNSRSHPPRSAKDTSRSRHACQCVLSMSTARRRTLCLPCRRTRITHGVPRTSIILTTAPLSTASP